MVKSVPSAKSRVAGQIAALGLSAALQSLRKKRSAPVTKVVRRRRVKFAETKSQARSGAVVMTKRRRKVFDGQAVENRFRSLQVYARRPSAYKLAMACLESQYYRVQGLTQFDTSYGYYPISNRLLASGEHILPLHFWDITSCTNFTGGVTSAPNVGHAGYLVNTGAAATTGVVSMRSQDATGATITGTAWIAENVSGGSDDLPKRKSFHHWTHVKANLYGVRKRATRYVVQLMMIKEVQADPLDGNNGSIMKKKLFDFLMRPFIYNNLNAGDPQTASDIKVLKTYETIIDLITTDQYEGATSVPKIQTLNWFINHNRIRRYDWLRDNPSQNDQNAGFDLESSGANATRVDPKYRVYLVIRALSPDRRTVTSTAGGFDIDADPISEPSYDIVIRNKFSNPT